MLESSHESSVAGRARAGTASPGTAAILARAGLVAAVIAGPAASAADHTPADRGAEGDPARHPDRERAAAPDRDADAWAARCPDADRVLLDAAGVAAFNRRLLDVDASVRDLADLPDTLAAAEVERLVRGCSRLPDQPLIRRQRPGPGDDAASADPPDSARVTAPATAAAADDFDADVGPADRDRWTAAMDLGSIPARVGPRFAVVTRRAALRRFPTADRVRRPGGPADIDLFQESAFFPGTPVAAVHATADGHWTFVLGTTYAAWVETEALAFTDRDTALDHACFDPAGLNHAGNPAGRRMLVVTAARATAVPLAGGSPATGLTPEGAAADGVVLDRIVLDGIVLDRIVLDMGTTLPAGRTVADGDRIVELPVRSAAGRLALVPARVEPAVALHDGPLPASRRHLLRQAFRFLGEPYGWGHDHGTRDCSGFVCDVYRSLGILLPRNTRDQAESPALDRTVVPADWPRDRRLAAVGGLRAGDLVYVPGHVMMIVGHDEAGPWVIHDTHGGRLAGAAAPAHGVVVAPLARMLGGDGGHLVDAVTVLVRVFPAAG